MEEMGQSSSILYESETFFSRCGAGLQTDERDDIAAGRSLASLSLFTVNVERGLRRSTGPLNGFHVTHGSPVLLLQVVSGESQSRTMIAKFVRKRTSHLNDPPSRRKPPKTSRPSLFLAKPNNTHYTSTKRIRPWNLETQPHSSKELTKLAPFSIRFVFKQTNSDQRSQQP